MGAFRLIYRLPWMLLHLLVGLPPTLLSFIPFFKAIELGGRPSECHHGELVVRYDLPHFRAAAHITGEFAPGAQLVVANHISWLDIQLLHSVSMMSFVAKAEIEKWPVVGLHGFCRRDGVSPPWQP